MEWLFILGFALSSNIDNFGVGISYGVRKVRIKWLSNLLIAAICFLFSMVGITFGRWISTILPGVFHVIVAVVLLTLIGIRIILLVGSQRNDGIDQLDSTGQVKVRSIGWIESSVLGVALSANALTNGLGAGLLWLSPLAISLTSAFGSFITVWLGVMVG
ncbi:sporulation membrane protein YtaF [Priestia megaterium]